MLFQQIVLVRSTAETAHHRALMQGHLYMLQLVAEATAACRHKHSRHFIVRALSRARRLRSVRCRLGCSILQLGLCRSTGCCHRAFVGAAAHVPDQPCDVRVRVRHVARVVGAATRLSGPARVPVRIELRRVAGHRTGYTRPRPQRVGPAVACVSAKCDHRASSSATIERALVPWCHHD